MLHYIIDYFHYNEYNLKREKDTFNLALKVRFLTGIKNYLEITSVSYIQTHLHFFFANHYFSVKKICSRPNTNLFFPFLTVTKANENGKLKKNVTQNFS